MWLLAYERFERAIAREASRVASRVLRADREGVRQGLVARLEGRSIPQGRIAETKNERFYSELAHGFMEIASSWEGLGLLQRLIRRGPPPGSDCSSVFYLRFLIEGHFHEAYICSNRLKALATRLERVYAPDEPETAARLKELGKASEKAFGSLARVRGHFVHARRDFDNDIENLSLLEFVADHPDARNEFLSAYRATRRLELATVTLRNFDIGRLLDSYFEVLGGLVLHKNGRFRLPRSCRAH